MTIAPLNAVLGLAGGGGSQASQGSAATGGFLEMVDEALRGVSKAQSSAAAAEFGYAVGAPGATLGKAVVASDRASIAWSAAVAVRNEVVSAYSTIMNMQF